MSDDDEIRVPASDVDDILDRAVDLAGEEPERGEAGVPLSEIERAAAEVGVPAEAVARAVAQQRSHRLGKRLLIAFVILVGCCASMGGLLATWMSAESERSAEGTGGNPAPTAAAPIPDAPPPGVPAGPEPVPAPPVAAPPEPDEPPEAVAPEEEPGTGDLEEPADPPTEEPSGDAPDAPGAQPGLLGGGPLSGEAVARAQTSIAGSWQLVGWVGAKGEPFEVPASARPSTEVSAEVWHFLAGGRFRRTIGDDFAASGRWSVVSETAPPAGVAWLGLETWWLIAMDHVQILALPGQVRPREWALMGEDGAERVIFYLGTDPVLSPTTLGARCVKGDPEGVRR